MTSYDADQSMSNPDITIISDDIINKSTLLIDFLQSQNQLQNLMEENPNLCQKLNELNSTLRNVSETIELECPKVLKESHSFENVSQSFVNIINEAEKNTLFKLKSQNLIDTLLSNQSKLDQLFNSNPDLDVNFDDLYDLLSELSNKIKNLNEPDFIMSILKEKKPIEKIISDVITTMNKINEELRKIGVQNPTKLPVNKILQDYTQIYDSLDDWINTFEKRKKEVTTTIKQCSKYHTNNGNETIQKILERFKEYKLEKEFFKKGDNLYYSFENFEYYNGKFAENNEPVLLMELGDNKYLSRILEVLTRLKHNCVESLVGFYVENEDENNEPKITIVTKRVGIDLYSFLHTSNKSIQNFEPGDRTILIYKIALAMSYVHSLNIIHRNMSTSSIYINKEKGKFPDIMISCFLGSRIMPKKVNQAVTCRPDINIGYNPPSFIAPEFDNSSSYNEKIDVFAFAAIIYELATGESPFSEYDYNTIITMLKNNQRPKFPEGFNNVLAELIQHCWEQDPEKRYTFNQIIKDLVQKNIIIDNVIGKNESDKKHIEESIKEFYKKSISNSEKISTCISLIENIKKDIMNAYQYQHILFSTRSLLNHFQNFLYHEYNQEKLDDAEEIDKIDKLIDNFRKFSSVVDDALPDKWKSNALTLPVIKIIEDTQIWMDAIKQSIVKLGFEGKDEYKQSEEDLIFDLRELYIFFEKLEDQSVSNKKRKEIIKIIKEINQNYLQEIKKPSIKQTYERIVNLFSNFNKFEFKCENFSLNYLVQQGKNSSVHEGYRIMDGKPVAIKVFDGNELGKSEKNLFNLRREVEYLARVDHKYIAKFVGYAINPKNCNVFLVTELAKSGTMEQMLNKKISQLTGTEKTKIAYKLADVMTYLNSQQIIHRGLTTSNIVLEGNRPKLIDFGNASSVIKGVDRDLFDNSTLNDAEYDANGDVLAFSKILYEMLTGEVPNGPEYGFDIDENNKSDLQKLIEFCSKPENQNLKTFEIIKNKMMHHHISFPGSNMDETNIFYDKKRMKLSNI